MAQLIRAKLPVDTQLPGQAGMCAAHDLEVDPTQIDQFEFRFNVSSPKVVAPHRDRMLTAYLLNQIRQTFPCFEPADLSPQLIPSYISEDIPRSSPNDQIQTEWEDRHDRAQ